MKSDDEAHLVAREGVVRAQPAICDARVFKEDFWEHARNDTKVCKTCKRLLREKQARGSSAGQKRG